MTVVFACVDADTLGGIQQVTHTLAQGMAERGHEVHVVGLDPTAAPFTYVEDPLYGRLSPKRLDALSDGFIVMTSPGVVTRLAGMYGELRPIGQYHGSYQHARGCAHLGSIRKNYGALDQAVFLSEDDAWLFSEHALLPNTWALPNPLATWPSTVSSLETPRVLGVGRLEGVKRFDRLISAFALASAPPWELHLLGDGAELGRLQSHAARLGVADRVVFRGRVPVSEMSAEYASAALLGLSSEHEGLPLVLVEAAAHGVPSVAFDVSGGVRSVGPVLVPPGDVEAFSLEMGRLMGSTEERRRLGAAARSRVEVFRLSNVLDRWDELFAHITR
ncbi:glycosyltransferase [Nonomuraea sp. NPDC050556]|uniref:glycosyltransferase n=1 Tax=Nonomuraea sp. NPDC050556 TaxID=3364369 RepID=UPI00378F36D4